MATAKKDTKKAKEDKAFEEEFNALMKQDPFKNEREYRKMDLRLKYRLVKAMESK